MKVIIVAYWKTRFSDLPYQHNQELEHSIETRTQIINTCLEKGYSVMIRPLQNGELIWIDNGRFGQS
jgi:hypothetical protein